MRIPAEAVIADSKIEDYLLVFRPKSDKSGYLASAGFSELNPYRLVAAIRELASKSEAVEDGSNEFGTFLRVEGLIRGPNGRELAVVTIWLKRKVDNAIHFVTLKPWRPMRVEPDESP